MSEPERAPEIEPFIDAHGRRHYRLRAETGRLGLKGKDLTAPTPEYVGIVIRGADLPMALAHLDGIEILSVEGAVKKDARG